jgi:peptidoglycan/xylan/chitin deacetylase (PgdA/CDA1 family)
VLQQTACADLPVILWSVDPEDWRVHDADAVTAHILRHAGPGSVILMHDLTDSSVTAALRVVDALQAQGYEFLTVSELAARSGTALRPGQAYCSFPP